MIGFTDVHYFSHVHMYKTNTWHIAPSFCFNGPHFAFTFSPALARNDFPKGELWASLHCSSFCIIFHEQGTLLWDSFSWLILITSDSYRCPSFWHKDLVGVKKKSQLVTNKNTPLWLKVNNSRTNGTVSLQCDPIILFIQHFKSNSFHRQVVWWSEDYVTFLC